MEGVKALQFNIQSQHEVHAAAEAVKKLAESYGLNTSDCATQFELACHNKQLLERQHKTLYSAWACFCDNNLTSSYTELSKLLKIAVTLPVTSASAERVHSKLKLVKSVLRSTSGDARMSDLTEIFVESELSAKIGLSELVDIFALKPRKMLL